MAGGDDDPGNGGTDNRRFLLGAAAILLLLTFADFFGGTGNIKEASAQKSSAPKFATKFMGPSIKFLYW